MVESPITINFANRSSAASRDCLKIEQEPWGKDVGETSNMQGILGIAAAINGGSYPEVNCAGMNGEFNATVYVYLCDPQMNYQFKVSHGTVSGRTAETKYREEIIQCSMNLEHTTDYPVRAMARMAWIGNCYDGRGNVVAHPTAEHADGVITVDQKVWGSLRVRYTVTRHTYHVTIQRRWEALENKYNSVAYCVWDGGVKWLDIEAPANFEAFDGDCGNGAFYDPNLQNGYEDGQLSKTDICQSEYNRLPVAATADRKIKINYCTQETISDVVNTTEDYESEKSGCDD